MRELTFDAVSNDPRHKTASRIKYILKLPKSLFDVHRWLVHLYKALELADCCKWFPHSNICLEAVRIWINLINSFIIELTNTANHDFSVINQIVCTFQLCTRVKPRAKEFSNTFFLKCWNQSSWREWKYLIDLHYPLIWSLSTRLLNESTCEDGLNVWQRYGVIEIYTWLLCIANQEMLYSGQLLHLLSFSGLTRLIMVGHVQQTVVRYNGSTVSFLPSWSNIHFVFLYTYIRFIKTGMNPMLFIYIHVQSNSHYLFKEEEANLLNQQINRPGLQTRNNLCTTPTMH